MTKPFWRSGALLVAGLLAIGCPQRGSVWIEPGSTAEHLVIRISRTPGGSGKAPVGYLSVDRCGGGGVRSDSTVWLIDAVDSVAYFDSVVYGGRPRGYQLEHGPLALTPGCYEVSTPGGTTAFDILPGGQVVEHRTK